MGHPGLDRLHIHPRTGQAPEKTLKSRPEGTARGGERPLLDQLPGGLWLPFDKRSIPLAAPVIAAGSSAWFGLGSWTAEQVGQEFLWVGYRLEMGALNPTPAADSDFAVVGNLAAWGNVDGTGAAIVIGMNLPRVVEGAWSSGPDTIPKVESTRRGGKGDSGTDRQVFHFAKGKQEDTPHPMVYRNSQDTPLCVMFTFGGDRLDVALVVRRASVNGVTKTDGLLMDVYGELKIASTITRGQRTE